jgi:hypothetical protein
MAGIRVEPGHRLRSAIYAFAIYACAIYAFDCTSKRRGCRPPAFAGACFAGMTYCAVRYVSAGRSYLNPLAKERISLFAWVQAESAEPEDSPEYVAGESGGGRKRDHDPEQMAEGSACMG